MDDLVYFTTQVLDTSNTSMTKALRMQQDCDKSNKSKTQAKTECNTSEYDTIATQNIRVRHECYTSNTSATLVKIFYFDNNTSENIFS